jgi:zinc/manganese transport system permease protein
MIIVAVGAAFAASFIGLLLSYYLNLPTGPAIILTSGAGYLISMLIGVQGGLLWQLMPRKHLEA